MPSRFSKYVPAGSSEMSMLNSLPAGCLSIRHCPKRLLMRQMLTGFRLFTYKTWDAGFGKRLKSSSAKLAVPNCVTVVVTVLVAMGAL